MRRLLLITGFLGVVTIGLTVVWADPPTHPGDPASVFFRRVGP